MTSPLIEGLPPGEFWKLWLACLWFLKANATALLALKWSDIEGGYVRVTIAGKIYREPLHPRLAQMLWRHKQRNLASERVFPIEMTPATPAEANAFLADLAKDAGVPTRSIGLRITQLSKTFWTTARRESLRLNTNNFRRDTSPEAIETDTLKLWLHPGGFR